MQRQLARIIEFKKEFQKFAGTVYEVDTYWHPEHGSMCVSFTRRGNKPNEKFHAVYEIRDAGYDAKGIAIQMKNHIKKQMNDAAARE